MSSLHFKKGKSTRSTLFSYYVDDLCSIVCHKIDMEKKKNSSYEMPFFFFFEGKKKEKTLTICKC